MHNVLEAQAVRLSLKAALKKARALRKKKHADHRVYLNLKREKKKLTRALRAEFQAALASWRALGTAMREAEREIKGLIADSDRRSRQFQLGFKVGQEYAQVQQKQAQIDQAQTTRRFQQ